MRDRDLDEKEDIRIIESTDDEDDGDTIDIDESRPSRQQRNNNDSVDDGDDGDDDHEDARLSDEDEDEDAESVAVRERSIRKEAVHHAITAEEQKLNSQAAYVKETYTKTKEDIVVMERILSNAVNEANGETTMQALRELDILKDRQHQCEDAWQSLEAQWAQVQEVKKTAKAPQNKTIKYAKQFKEKIDLDSLPQSVQKKIYDADNQLAKSRRTDTKEYWELLEKKVRHLIPNENKMQSKSKKSNSNSSSRTAGNEVYISRERKEALIAAGIWDDPVLRNKYVKQYQKWDKENADRTHNDPF